MIASVPSSSVPPLLAAQWVDDILKSLTTLRDSAIDMLPKLLGALILFVAGYLIAVVVRRFVTGLLGRIGVNALSDRIGIGDILLRANIRTPVSVMVGKAFFWVLVLMFLITAVDSLGMPQFSEPLHGLVAFLPKAVTALIIFTVGFLVSDLVRGVTLQRGRRLGLEYAEPLSNLIYGFLFILVAIVAVGTLGVDTTLIRHTVEIFLLAGALAIALALGLGMRPLAQNIVSGVYARDLYRPGTMVRLKDGDEEVEVVSVGPVLTRFTRKNGETIMMPNSHLVTEVIASRPRPPLPESE